MLVYMNDTHASPQMILSKGSVYDLPNRAAKKLTTSRSVAGADWVKDAKGVDVMRVSYAPHTVGEQYNPAKHGKKSVNRVPLQPDPEDRPETIEDDDFLEDDE